MQESALLFSTKEPACIQFFFHAPMLRIPIFHGENFNYYQPDGILQMATLA